MKKGTTRPGNLRDRLEKRIARRRGYVFLRADFDDLGGYDQVGRALRQLVEQGRLMKIGYGMYTRTCPSILDGTPVPAKSIRELAAEALGRLGIETAPTRMDIANASGKSTQVPTGRVVGVRGRLRRKIGYNGVYLKFERVGLAPRSRNTREGDTSMTAPQAPPITVGEALYLIWQADHYPILGNEDLQASRRLEEEALSKAANAIPEAADPSEWAQWLAVLLSPSSSGDERENVMSALYDLFDPEPSARAETPIDSHASAGRDSFVDKT